MAASIKDKEWSPRVVDSITKESILLDCGAMISCWPKHRYPGAMKDPFIKLEAVNKSSIDTYGKRTINIRVGRKMYSHEVILADIPKPVLGWDFIRAHQLSFIWSDSGDLILWDRKANIKQVLNGSNHENGINLSGFEVVEKRPQISAVEAQQKAASCLRSFQVWSQPQNIKATKQAKAVPIPQKYQKVEMNKTRGLN